MHVPVSFIIYRSHIWRTKSSSPTLTPLRGLRAHNYTRIYYRKGNLHSCMFSKNKRKSGKMTKPCLASLFLQWLRHPSSPISGIERPLNCSSPKNAIYRLLSCAYSWLGVEPAPRRKEPMWERGGSIIAIKNGQGRGKVLWEAGENEDIGEEKRQGSTFH